MFASRLVSRPVSPKTAQLLVRTKDYVSAHFVESIRLADVGKAVGASPVYLTDLFRRVEGISLHRYIVRLRLRHALDCLAGANDLTALALQSGFSSHSHFTLAFRRAFGATPSEFRAFMRDHPGGGSPGAPERAITAQLVRRVTGDAGSA